MVKFEKSATHKKGDLIALPMEKLYNVLESAYLAGLDDYIMRAEMPPGARVN